MLKHMSQSDTTMLSELCQFFALVLLASKAESAKILGVFTIPSVSHQVVYQPIWRELSLRGHEVTVLTPNPLKDPSLTNLTEIDLSFQYKNLEEMKELLSEGVGHWSMPSVFHQMFSSLFEHMFDSDEVSKFIQDNTTAYDLLLVEAIDSMTLAFAAKYKCPFIGISSVNVGSPTYEAIGTPGHPILYPDVVTPYYAAVSGFFEKVDAVLFSLYARYINSCYFAPTLKELTKKYFDEVADMQDIERNMSLLLINTNPVIHKPRPYGQNVIELGGRMHLKPKKPLPSDLQSFLDNATEGVIYFSLGSNIKSKYLPENKRNILIDTFAELPYKVLWKFEDDQLSEKPKNVHIRKWLPQQDLLGHQNIKLFITQGGLQSLEEALHDGVPLIALPFIGDQPANARRIQALGIGLNLDFRTLTKQTFLEAILAVTSNPRYKQKAVEIGKLMRDQPMTGLEKAVWWIEYAIRNKGALHLRSPLSDVSWFEFLVLDVAALFLSIFAVTLLVLYKAFRFVINLVFPKRQPKMKTQ